MPILAEYRSKKTAFAFLGILVSVFFLFLVFREVNLQLVILALQEADYLWFVPAIFVLFLSHWLRALRHRYLLDPIRRTETYDLFSALMIGYMANSILPAHLGELLRAYIISRKCPVPGSSALATIAVERVIDVFTLLVIMTLTFTFFPFPAWVRISGYLMFGFGVALTIILFAIRKHEENVNNWIGRLLLPVSPRIHEKVSNLLRQFIMGITPLSNWSCYAIVIALSLLIWVGYLLVYIFGFLSFDFVNGYNLSYTAGLVSLVMTTIAVVVPSSPGYVGTYHWLCMKSLELFGVPNSESFSFAAVVHAVSLFPVVIIGFVLAWKEGYSISKIQLKPD